MNIEVKDEDMMVKRVNKTPKIIQVDPFRQFCEMLAASPDVSPDFKHQVIKSLNNEKSYTIEAPSQ